MIEPTFASPGQTLRLSADKIVKAVKSLISSGTEASFLAAAADRDIAVIASAETVNFVKSFLFEHGIHEIDPAAVALIQSPKDEECPHVGNG